MSGTNRFNANRQNDDSYMNIFIKRPFKYSIIIHILICYPIEIQYQEIVGGL